jgi:hypothetical protein
MFGAVSAFKMKLKLFRKQLENINMRQFPSCDFLHRMGQKVFPFQGKFSAIFIVALVAYCGSPT